MSLRFSLRSMLLAVALAALGTAALVNASQAWLCAIASLSLAVLLTGVTLAINTKDSLRAFWIGFLTWGLLYLAVVWLLWQGEMSNVPGRLVTTEMLRFLYLRIAKEVQVPGDAGFPPMTTYVPYFETFLAIGHLLWAWILAWIGGVVGRATYVRFHAPIVRQPGGNSLTQ